MIEWAIFGVSIAGTILRGALAIAEVIDFRVAQAVDRERTAFAHFDFYIIALRDVLKTPIGILLVLWGLTIGVWRLLTPDSPIPPTPREIWGSVFVMIVPIGLCAKSAIDWWARRKIQSGT